MSVLRDPFDLRRSPASDIIRGTATNITQGLRKASAKAYDTSKQALEDMSSLSAQQNTPTFPSPQREMENRAWGASGITARSHTAHTNAGVISGMQDRMGTFFEKKSDLPMYKDKPYSYASSRRRQPVWRRKGVIGIATAFGLFMLYMLGFFSSHESADAEPKRGWTFLPGKGKSGSKVDWLERRESVREAFAISWDAYERYAWGMCICGGSPGILDTNANNNYTGYDEFHPVSKRGKQMTPEGMGWIIVDALDTMMIMNLTSRLTHAREWMTNSLTYEQDQEVNTFETTIRMLGGLLSAYYLSTEFPDLAPLTDDDEGAPGQDLYREKATDLADRLMGAFDSPSGIPWASVNLKTSKGVPSHADGGASSTAEAATLQLELKYLAKITGEVEYWEKAEKVMQVLDDNGAEAGLVPIFVYADSGKFRGENIRLGSRGDSYYEYLIKQYLQTSKEEPVYEEMWNEALDGVRKHLITYSTPSRFTVLGERPDGLKGALSPKVDHLACFMPGTIALGATGGISEAEAKKLSTWSSKKDEDMKLARELTQSCWGMYKFMATGLAPEITHFHIEDPPLPASADHLAPETFDDSEHAEWRQDFSVKPGDLHNLQRPETVESLFYMWRITGDVMYREWGWEMFKSFMNHTAIGDLGGFTSLSNANVIPPVFKDNMESFWLVSSRLFVIVFVNWTRSNKYTG